MNTLERCDRKVDCGVCEHLILVILAMFHVVQQRVGSFECAVM